VSLLGSSYTDQIESRSGEVKFSVRSGRCHPAVVVAGGPVGTGRAGAPDGVADGDADALASSRERWAMSGVELAAGVPSTCPIGGFAVEVPAEQDDIASEVMRTALNAESFRETRQLI